MLYLGALLISLQVAKGSSYAAALSSSTVVDTAGGVGVRVDRTVVVATTGAETPEATDHRELFYRIDDELLKLWNADDDCTFLYPVYLVDTDAALRHRQQRPSLTAVESRLRGPVQRRRLIPR